MTGARDTRVPPPRNEHPARRPGTDGAVVIVAGRSIVVNDRTGTLFAGIDWASRTHAACVVDARGAVRARFEIPSTGKSFAGLVRRLVKLEVSGVAIERGDG